MMRLCAAVSALLLVSAASAFLFDEPPATVEELDIPKYLGRWYQVYGNLFTEEITIGPDALCIMADYSPVNATTIALRNSNRDFTGDGPLKTIEGLAYATDEPGQLQVKFNFGDGVVGPPGGAPYWILKLGPVNEDGQYDYSVVSDPDRLFLFILTRDVERFDEKYDEEVLAFVEEEGFTDFFNKPRRSSQENCDYIPPP